VYRMPANARGAMEEVFTIQTEKASYTHSFGLTKGDKQDHVIIVQQPIHYNMMELIATGTLEHGFTNDLSQKTNIIHVAPLKKGADKEVVTFEVPRFFFGHTVNSFSRGDGKFVVDVNMQNDLFFDRYSLNILRNKTLRDAWPMDALGGTKPGWQTIMRIELDTTTKTLSQSYLYGNAPDQNMEFEQDLFKLHPSDYGREYCGYWAVQSHAMNSTSFASGAIVRAEICGDVPRLAATWYRANVYPGEPSFVPKPGSSDKTEGTLVFKAFDGNSKQSLLVVCDAKTLTTISEAVLPIQVPFAIHGDFFPSAKRQSSEQYV